ncbi:hypothetical protein D092_04230 [Rhodococcus ruber Chol-4]|uniref:hypothetical protein n=1 Tax=Rhodococcus ruber TaxID=1830 RepID=UPI0003727B39|nr:hypothetical protein [Rhodococcus ruber]KXF88254.1 hypothetical protein D092_04230 [Rhodococcus ruber Chol-4]
MPKDKADILASVVAAIAGGNIAQARHVLRTGCLFIPAAKTARSSGATSRRSASSSQPTLTSQSL